jgi:hypothetical protein
MRSPEKISGHHKIEAIASCGFCPLWSQKEGVTGMLSQRSRTTKKRRPV